MPIIKSAKKRVKVAAKATARNAKSRRSIRGAIKSFHSAVTSKKDASSKHVKAQSELDKAVKKGLIHKNKAARKKSQLAKKAKAAGSKPAKKAAKPAVAKKPVAKKPVAKKAPAKKPVAKKPAAKKK